MRRIIFYTSLFILAMFANKLNAQDWMKINPDGADILVDTTIIRAVVVTVESGETMGPVTHPTNFAYILDGGNLSVKFHGRETKKLDLKKGMYLYNSPEGPHTVKNIGDDPVSFLLVELKEYPYVEPEANK